MDDRRFTRAAATYALRAYVQNIREALACEARDLDGDPCPECMSIAASFLAARLKFEQVWQLMGRR